MKIGKDYNDNPKYSSQDVKLEWQSTKDSEELDKIMQALLTDLLSKNFILVQIDDSKRIMSNGKALESHLRLLIR